MPMTGPDASAIPLGALSTRYAFDHPKRPMITTETEVVRWGEFEERCNRRAHQLASAGVSAGDFVSIILPNGCAFYEATFAAWKLGATPNPISAKSPAPERDALLSLVRPRAIIAAEAFDCGGVPFLRGDVPAPPVCADTQLENRVAPYWKAIGSGGSTGRPKLIVDHMPGAWSEGTPALGIESGDTVLNPGPLHHNAPFTFAHAALFLGGHVVEGGRFDAERTLQLIARHRVAWVCLVPTMMHRIWRLAPMVREGFDLSSLRRVVHMAAACPAWLKEAWIDWLGPDRVWELYGGTERQGSTLISGSEWRLHRGSVGLVQAGARLRILDDAGAEVAPGTVGEIYFLPDGGAGSTYHYIGAEPRRDGVWESLGDLGYVDADGYLYLVDRRADLIISGGSNIYPAEVEGALEAHPSVACSVVIGLPDADLGQSVHALVELAPGAREPSPFDLKAFLADRLSSYKLPKTFEFVDQPLRDDAGKARRGALRDDRVAGLHASREAT
jgi:bile acid-coenzyme A ligase